MTTHDVHDGRDGWLTLAGEAIRVRLICVEDGRVELEVDAPSDCPISLIDASGRAEQCPSKSVTTTTS